MKQKRPEQENSQENVLLSPGCREKRGRTCCPTPPNKHYSSRGKEELSPFHLLSMKVLFQKDY